MKVLSFLMAVLMLASSGAFAQESRYDVESKARDLVDALSNPRRQLSQEQLRAISSGLDQAFDALSGGRRRGPVCQVTGAGTYRGYSWNFLVNVNDQTLEAADSLDAALEKVRKFQEAGVCTRSDRSTCALRGYGTYRGYSWNYILTSEGAPLLAADSLESIQQSLSQLQSAGMCPARPTASCSLLPAGDYRGYSWNYRVAINGEAVDAADSLDAATQKMSKLRSMNFCY